MCRCPTQYVELYDLTDSVTVLVDEDHRLMRLRRLKAWLSNPKSSMSRTGQSLHREVLD